MEERTILLDSWKTSNSTITLKEFRLLGIADGYKYVPKAHEIVPPFMKEVKLPGKNINLTIVTDCELFSEYHKEDLVEEDCAVVQMESQKEEEEEEEVMSTGSSDSFSSTDDTAIEDNSTEDTSIEDTSIEDNSIEDTSIEDNSIEDTSIEDTSIEDTSLKGVSDCDSMECSPDIQSQQYYPLVKLYTPQEYDPDLQSNSLDTSTSFVKEDASMANLSQKSDSDCESMECNPDIYPDEYYPEKEIKTPQEYNSDMQSQSLGEYTTYAQYFSLDEYNPWQPEM